MSRAESGMLLEAAEEEQVAKWTFRKHEVEAEYAFRSLGLRTVLPGLNTKPAFMSKGTWDS